MVRTQIYLTEEEKAGVEAVAASRGISQSDVIRLAVDDLLAGQGVKDKTALIDRIAGVWAGREDLPDVRQLRAGWKRGGR